jgi:hypothetical protein
MPAFRNIRNMRPLLLAGSLALAALGAAAPAVADNEPVIVVPGRPGVPVMMYGVDVSGAVIEGEWGLNRPGVVAPTVIMRYSPPPSYQAPAAYFPANGQRPRVGRVEVIPPPNRRLPKPAEPFYRDWMTQSDPGPVTIPTPYDTPPVVVAPRFSRVRPAHHAPAPHPSPKSP